MDAAAIGMEHPMFRAAAVGAVMCRPPCFPTAVGLYPQPFPLPPLCKGRCLRSRRRGCRGTRFFWRPAPKQVNFAGAHIARRLARSKVSGCRPPFPLGSSDGGISSDGMAHVVHCNSREWKTKGGLRPKRGAGRPNPVPVSLSSISSGPRRSCGSSSRSRSWWRFR